jgi:hypothetical protein
MEINHDMIRTERCARAFGSMFWGFLFLFDFRIGTGGVQVDLLPDFIGWILIASALENIRDLSPRVGGIRTLAQWLIFFSLFSLVEIKKKGHSGFTVSANMSINLTSPFRLIGSILAVLVIWKLCGLIMEMAEAVGDTLIRDRAEFRRMLYLIFIVSLPVVFGLVLLDKSLALFVLAIEIPFALIVFCLLMGLMKGTENMCRGSWQ